MNTLESSIILDFKNYVSISDIVEKHKELGVTTYIITEIIKRNGIKRNKSNKMLQLFGEKPSNIKVIDHNIPKVPIVSVTKNSITDTMDELLQRSKNTINECNINSERRQLKKKYESANMDELDALLKKCELTNEKAKNSLSKKNNT